MTRFQQILPDTLRYEGGFSDHSEDPGGATMQGVTLATFRSFYGADKTEGDLRNITRGQLERIYEAGYWYPSCAYRMWVGLDRVAFDAAVNSGPKRSLRWVQKAVGTAPDGIWGPKTDAAVKRCTDRPEAVQRACAVRMAFLHRLRHWKTFGRGWSKRVATVEARAVRECSGPGRVKREAELARLNAKAQGAGAAGAGGGSGVLPVSDMPVSFMAVLGLLLAVCAVALFLKSRHNAHRAEAYEELT